MGGGTEEIFSITRTGVCAHQTGRDQKSPEDIQQMSKHYRLGLYSVFSGTS